MCGIHAIHRVAARLLALRLHYINGELWSNDHGSSPLVGRADGGLVGGGDTLGNCYLPPKVADLPTPAPQGCRTTVFDSCLLSKIVTLGGRFFATLWYLRAPGSP